MLYLVKNDDTGFYDIYAKVDEDVVRLDDTTTNMDGYVSDEDLSTAIKDFIKLAALSVEETGDGNAVTGLSYDSTSGKFTATKGKTFLTAEDVPVATDGEVTSMLNSVFSPDN